MLRYQRQLLDWYHQNKRDLPWRRTKEPYAIWVSEVMLQQTQVDTVIPYYERFMKRFPTIESLAEASLEEVYKYWQGLGYYRRAQNLHKGAVLILKEYDGIFPMHIKEAKKIPSIGPYTLGAVLSIAFDMPLPAVDGNVMRVLSRQFLIEADISVAKHRKIFEEQVMQLMPNDPSSFNQALMELGATICTPKNPKCTRCPVNDLCLGYREGIAENFPVKTKKQKVQALEYYVLLVAKEGRFLMEKRPDGGLLAKLWGFPMCEINELENLVSYPQANLKCLQEVTHIFTHRKWLMKPIIVPYEKLNFSQLNHNDAITKWVSVEEMQGLPIATAFLKVCKQL